MKRTLLRSSSIVVFAALVSFAPTRVEATPLLPGATGVVPSLNTPFDPGQLLASMVTPFITNTGTITGTFSSAVYRNASGFLDFYYQLTSDPTSTSQISGVSGFSFGGFTTDVSYRTDAFDQFSASLKGPLTAARSSDGSEVQFWFGPDWTPANKIGPGQTSSTMLISTNATFFGGGFSTIQNHGWVTVHAFQPSSVPEPATLGVALLGAVGLFARRRKT